MPTLLRQHVSVPPHWLFTAEPRTNQPHEVQEGWAGVVPGCGRQSREGPGLRPHILSPLPRMGGGLSSVPQALQLSKPWAQPRHICFCGGWARAPEARNFPTTRAAGPGWAHTTTHERTTSEVPALLLPTPHSTIPRSSPPCLQGCPGWRATLLGEGYGLGQGRREFCTY